MLLQPHIVLGRQRPRQAILAGRNIIAAQQTSQRRLRRIGEQFEQRAHPQHMLAARAAIQRLAGGGAELPQILQLPQQVRIAP
jgi:hypothetical protein